MKIFFLGNFNCLINFANIQCKLKTTKIWFNNNRACKSIFCLSILYMPSILWWHFANVTSSDYMLCTIFTVQYNAMQYLFCTQVQVNLPENAFLMMTLWTECSSSCCPHPCVGNIESIRHCKLCLIKCFISKHLWERLVQENKINS